MKRWRGPGQIIAPSCSQGDANLSAHVFTAPKRVTGHCNAEQPARNWCHRARGRSHSTRKNGNSARKEWDSVRQNGNPARTGAALAMRAIEADLRAAQVPRVSAENAINWRNSLQRFGAKRQDSGRREWARAFWSARYVRVP